MLLYKYRVKCSKAISGWDGIGSLLGGAKNCTIAIKVHFYKAHLLSVAIRSSIDLGADVRVAVFLLYLTLHVIAKHRTLLNTFVARLKDFVARFRAFLLFLHL